MQSSHPVDPEATASCPGTGGPSRNYLAGDQAASGEVCPQLADLDADLLPPELLSRAIAERGGRVSLAKVVDALAVVVELNGTPIPMKELGARIKVSRGRVAICPLVDVGFLTRVRREDERGRQLPFTFEVTPSGRYALAWFNQRAPGGASSGRAPLELLGRAPLRAPFGGGSIRYQPTNQGARDARISEWEAAILSRFTELVGTFGTVYGLRDELHKLSPDWQTPDLVEAVCGNLPPAVVNPAGLLRTRVRSLEGATPPPPNIGPPQTPDTRTPEETRDAIWAAAGIDDPAGPAGNSQSGGESGSDVVARVADAAAFHSELEAARLALGGRRELSEG